MYGFNKYKVITISFICVFVFLVATMYTTTKNVAQKQITEQEQQDQLRAQALANKKDRLNKENELNENSNENLSDQIYNLKTQIDYMARDIETIKTTDAQLKCRIRGIYNNGSIEEVSPDTALNESRNSGAEIALICTY